MKKKKPKHNLTEIEFMAMFKWYMDHGTFDTKADIVFTEWSIFYDKFPFSNLIQFDKEQRSSYGYFYKYIVNQFFQMADSAYARQHQYGDER